MAHPDSRLVPAVSMDDEVGIVYLIETVQQFWSELEDVLKLPNTEHQTLILLDAALRRFLSLCSAYHEQYLQTPLQLEHAFQILLNSELFEFHSERMCEIIMDDTQANTDPHSQFVSYNVLFWYGKRKLDFFRSYKRWQPLFLLLMDHIMVDIDSEIEDTYTGIAGTSIGLPSIPVPIEVKLRTVAVQLLYEVCRMQNFSLQDLRVFDDDFIDHLFDLVEQTRDVQDDTFNYSVIKLIISLNEQFMVASLLSDSQHPGSDLSPEKNRVFRVLMRRLGLSKTFGENIIFMLNRAKRTQEDLCVQLLILKILYLVFTTKGTSEYFYTNDLCVLVDVFLRELVDLDEESESLRHSYLRVLHPLLTKTQLRDYPYKRPQILYTLESLIGRSNIRDINPTTKRLVERCLDGDWCVQLRARRDEENASQASNNSDAWPRTPSSESHVSTAIQLERSNSKIKTPKSSRSVENLKVCYIDPRPPISSLSRLRQTSNSSSTSLFAMVDSKPASNVPGRRGTQGSTIVGGTQAHKHYDRMGSHGGGSDFHTYHHQLLAPVDSPRVQQAPLRTRSRPPPPPPLQTRMARPLMSMSSPTPTVSSDTCSDQPRSRRRPPPAPPKRSKPPTVPSERTNSGATITVIRSSELPVHL